MSAIMPIGHRQSSGNYACRALAKPRRQRHAAAVKNLKSIRTSRRLSQTQLAEMVGINQATISKIENGNESVTLDLVFKIAAALNVPAGLLFPHGDLEDRALVALSQVDPARREAAIVVLEAMAKE